MAPHTGVHRGADPAAVKDADLTLVPDAARAEASEAGPEAASAADRAQASDADRGEASVAGPEAASAADRAEVQDAVPGEVRVADLGEASVADPEAASAADRAQASDADRAAVSGDARADRNACCRAGAPARRDAVRSHYGQVRCYRGCCRRGNSRTDLQ
ncbi:hypothetical protein CH254_13390 [Rhodococcus sp. 06-412-2C]|nr:hypothetical protein CH254_13390 [Rhodococcus sp. 06-412-2C]OZD03199.1 hypothetical protein CH279_02920 [Rhodococcus sp. 06-412-2B]